jgi:hypothetical protein
VLIVQDVLSVLKQLKSDVKPTEELLRVSSLPSSNSMVTHIASSVKGYMMISITGQSPSHTYQRLYPDHPWHTSDIQATRAGNVMNRFTNSSTDADIKALAGDVLNSWKKAIREQKEKRKRDDEERGGSAGAGAGVGTPGAEEDRDKKRVKAESESFASCTGHGRVEGSRRQGEEGKECQTGVLPDGAI